MQYFTKELWRDMNDERDERMGSKQSTVLREVRNDKKSACRRNSLLNCLQETASMTMTSLK